MRRKKLSTCSLGGILLVLACLQAIFFLCHPWRIGSDQLHQSNNDLIPPTYGKTTSSTWRPSQQWIQECVDRQERQGRMLEPFDIAWKGYTLGDCVLMCYKCRISIRSSPLKKQSFAGQYLRRACPKGGVRYVNNETTVQWNVMDAILGEATGETPPDHGIVIHLRLGDVIEQANATVVDMLWKGGSPAHKAQYSNSIKPISEYLDNIEQTNTRIQRKHPSVFSIPIILRGGAHFHVYYKARDQKISAPKSRT